MRHTGNDHKRRMVRPSTRKTGKRHEKTPQRAAFCLRLHEADRAQCKFPFGNDGPSSNANVYPGEQKRCIHEIGAMRSKPPFRLTCPYACSLSRNDRKQAEGSFLSEGIPKGLGRAAATGTVTGARRAVTLWRGFGAHSPEKAPAVEKKRLFIPLDRKSRMRYRKRAVSSIPQMECVQSGPYGNDTVIRG